MENHHFQVISCQSLHTVQLVWGGDRAMVGQIASRADGGHPRHGWRMVADELARGLETSTHVERCPLRRAALTGT